MEDLIQFSLRENRFWLDIMSEHALFLKSGFPCDAGALIEEAGCFQNQFTALKNEYDRLVDPPVEQVMELNDHSIDLTEGFIYFKTRILDMLINCQLGGSNYPSVVVHMRREAMRFAQIIRMANRMADPGQGLLKESIAMDEVFWTLIMDEHSETIGQLLDPSMKPVIMAARGFAMKFEKLNREARRVEEKAERCDARTLAQFSRSLIPPVREVREFDAAMYRQLKECEILAVMPPLLADHMRRESDKFLEDLADHIEDLETIMRKGVSH